MRVAGLVATVLVLVLAAPAAAESRRFKDSAFVCVTLGHLEELQTALRDGDRRHLAALDAVCPLLRKGTEFSVIKVWYDERAGADSPVQIRVYGPKGSAVVWAWYSHVLR